MVAVKLILKCRLTYLTNGHNVMKTFVAQITPKFSLLSCIDLDWLKIFALRKHSLLSPQALVLHPPLLSKTTWSLLLQGLVLGILISFVNTFCFNYLCKNL